MSPKTKSGLLVAAHIVGGLFLAATYRDSGRGASQMDVGLYSIVLAEAGLLGIWGALGTPRPIVRLPAVLTATAYLCVLIMAAERDWSLWPTLGFIYLANIGLPTGIIVLVLSGLRYSRWKLRLAKSLAVSPTIAVSPTVERFQFTIRHVLVTTAAVAVVLAFGRGIRTLDFYYGYEAILILLLIMVDLTVLWAALSIGRPTVRLAVVVPMAFLLGVIPVCYLHLRSIFTVDWKEIVNEPTTFGLQATITAASLLIVRSCGWRLVSGLDQIECATDTTWPLTRATGMTTINGCFKEDPMSPKLKIGLLLAGHVASDAILGWVLFASPGIIWPHPLLVGFLALVFAEAGLIGVWAALGTISTVRQIPMVLGSTTYLMAVLATVASGVATVTRDELVSLLLLIVIPATLILGVLKLVKRRRNLLMIQSSLSPQGSTGLQFTIRHLFIFTTLVAAVLAIGRVLRSIGFGQPADVFALVPVVGLCIVLIELAILWATLCAERPVVRLGIVLPLALVVGAIPPFYLAPLLTRDGAYVSWPAMFGLQAAITAGSLLVVRSNGWRLVSGADEQRERPGP